MAEIEELWPGEASGSAGGVTEAPRREKSKPKVTRSAPAKAKPRKRTSKTDIEEQYAKGKIDEDQLARDFALRAKEQLEQQERLHQQERFQEQSEQRQANSSQVQNKKVKYLPVFKPVRDWESELAKAHAEAEHYQHVVEELREELGWLRQRVDESIELKMNSDGSVRRLKADAEVQCGSKEEQIDSGIQTDISQALSRTVGVQSVSILTSTVPTQTDAPDSTEPPPRIPERIVDVPSVEQEAHEEEIAESDYTFVTLAEPRMSELLPASARLVGLGSNLGVGGWKWCAAVLAKNDQIYCPPCDASRVLCIEPGTQKIETIGPDLGSGRWKWVSGAMGDDGRVYCPPRDAQHTLCIEPWSGHVELIGPDFGVSETKWVVAVSALDGHVYCPPCDASKVLRIEPSTGAVELIGPDLGLEESKWMAAVLASDGNVYCPPCNASQVLRIRPRIPETGQDSIVDLIDADLGLEPQKFLLALAGGDGCVYCPPYNFQKVMRIQPETGVCEFVGPDFGSERGKWVAGAVEHQSGNIFCPPCDASSVLRIDVTKLEIELVGSSIGIGEDKWRTAVSGSDGLIYGLPCDASRAICIDPRSGKVELVGDEWGGRWKVVAAISGTDGHIYCPAYNIAKVMMLQIGLVSRQNVENFRLEAQSALTKFKQGTEDELARRKRRIQLLQNDVQKLKRDAKRDVGTMREQQKDMEELQADILRERTSQQDEPQRRSDAEAVVRAQRHEIESWRCSHTAAGRPQLLVALPDRQLLSMAQAALRLTSHKSNCEGGKSMQSATVLRVQRIVNNQLWSAYERSKYEARKRPARPASLSPGSPAALLQSFQWFADSLEDSLNERLAFHGCPSIEVRRIARDGFNIQTDASKAIFGLGTYFAEESCKAFKDCRQERDSGEYCLILARLMLGDAYEVQKPLETDKPPVLSNGKTFDSVVVHPGTPAKSGSFEAHRLFVTFLKSQAYPEIAIFFNV